MKSLLTIEVIKLGDLAKPASTNREVIDNSYSYSLLTVFENMQAHDIYQPHPVHQNFINTCAHFWSKVLIYDSETV